MELPAAAISVMQQVAFPPVSAHRVSPLQRMAGAVVRADLVAVSQIDSPSGQCCVNSIAT